MVVEIIVIAVIVVVIVVVVVVIIVVVIVVVVVVVVVVGVLVVVNFLSSFAVLWFVGCVAGLVGWVVFCFLATCFTPGATRTANCACATDEAKRRPLFSSNQ